MITYLILIGLLITIISFSLRQLFSYKPTATEAKAIMEISDFIKDFSDYTTNKLRNSNVGIDINYYQENLNRSINSTIGAHIDQVDKNLPVYVDNDLYMAAVKSVVPKKSWKDDFNYKIKYATENLLSSEELEQKINTLFKDSINDFKSELQNNSKKEIEEFRGRELSSETIEFLKKMEQNPDLSKKIFGKDKIVQNLVMQGLQKDLAIGASLIFGGAVYGFLLEEFGTEMIIEVGFPIASYIIANSVIGDYITEFLLSWIAEEGAEHVVQEIFEAIAAALTGVGLLFTGYKMYKYSTLINRMLIKKEPLQLMRSKIRENVVENIRNIEQGALEKANQFLLMAFNAHNNFNANLILDLNKAKETAIRKHKWASSYV